MPTSSDYSRLESLALHVDSLRLELQELEIPGRFRRATSLVVLEGSGKSGCGEDVNYVADEQDRFVREGAGLDLRGDYTLSTFSRRLDEVNLFPTPLEYDAAADYRRWAFESAALDLALRQAGSSLHQALGRTPAAVTFAVSMQLESEEAVTEFQAIRERHSGMHFKLDPTPSWSATRFDSLASMDVVDVLDLKGAYKGTPVDNPPDPALYRRVAEAFPDAWIEDPAWTAKTAAVLEPHRARITWDAPIHSVADMQAMPVAARTMNMKPSRFGTLQRLFAAYAYCEENGIGMYGGGQFELGVGRGQIQCLASLFHPSTCNDVSPVAYHQIKSVSELPASPVPGGPEPRGFRWSAAPQKHEE